MLRSTPAELGGQQQQEYVAASIVTWHGEHGVPILLPDRVDASKAAAATVSACSWLQA
jgi:hypothetical protein